MEETLSMCKLKTLEYRIYRKLREKLRSFLNQPSQYYRPFNKYLKKFQEEVRVLCEGYNLPCSLDFYNMIAQKAFEFGENYYDYSTIIYEEFISFLSLLLYQLSQKKKLTPNDFNKKTLQKAMSLRWSSLVSQISTPLRTPKEKKNKKIYIFAPIGIPGMGKSFNLKILERLLTRSDISVHVVSSDRIRKECMDHLATNPKLSRDEIFKESKAPAEELFFKRLNDAVLHAKKSQKYNFLLIDKNHPPLAINSLKKLAEFAKKVQVEFELIAILPIIDGDLFAFSYHHQTYQFPFPAEFFFTCLSRLQNRKEHDTLPGNGTKSANILTMFFNLYRDFPLDNESLLKYGFTQTLALPLTGQSKKIYLPSELTQALIKVLQITSVGSLCPDESAINYLLDVFEKGSLALSFPDTRNLETVLIEFLNKSIFQMSEAIKIPKEVIKEQKFAIPSFSEIPPKLDSQKSQKEDLPIYLDLFTLEDFKKQIQIYTLDTLNQIVKKFPSDQNLQRCFEKSEKDFPLKMKFVKDFHVTSLYIGNNHQLKETENFTTFSYGQKIDLILNGLVVIPEKIVIGICYDQSKIKIANQFPHMTIMTGSYRAKEINDILEILFGSNCCYQKEYEQKVFSTLSSFSFRNQVQIRGREETVYLIKVSDLRIATKSDTFFV